MSDTIESSIPPEKLELLRQHLRTGKAIDYAEVIAVHWPDQTRYYAHSAWHRSENFKSIPWQAEVALWAEAGTSRLTAPVFVNFSTTYATSDETISFTLSDPDGAFLDLFEAHGDGIKVEVLAYLGGAIDCALPPLWWGLLQSPEDTEDPDLLSVQATNGYRNASTLTPRRLMSTVTCQRVWAGQLDTQEKIDKNGCPNNRHLPGGAVGLIDPDTNLPFTSCPKTNEACLARIGGDPNTLPILAFKSILGDQLVPQTKGPGLLATTRGNESALNQPLPVIYGHRILRELPVLTMQIQGNTRHPEEGSVSAIFPASEGPVQSMASPEINGTTVQAGQFQQNLGTTRQAALWLTDTMRAANYSDTAHFRALIFGAFSGRTAADFKGKIEIYGRSTVRSPDGAGNYNEEYTVNRAKCLYDVLTNNRYGNGDSDALFEPSDWLRTLDDGSQGGIIPACDQTVVVQDASGEPISSTRSTFNAQVEGTATEELIKDITLWGNFGIFQYEGKKRIKLLGREQVDADNLPFNVPTFTDGVGGNIWVDREPKRSSLRILRQRATDLADQLTVFFEDEVHNNIRRPLTFDYEDVRARRGKALGDTTPAPRGKQLNAYGITNLGEAVRMANIIGDVGEFCSGGRKNNLGVRFLTPYLTPEALQLYPFRLIKIINARVNRFREATGEAAEYFYVQSLRRFGDMRSDNGLMYEVTAWWYPRGYWASVEAETLPADLMVGADGEALLAEEEITD